MTKDFDGWNNVKKTLELCERPPLFKEREIWWCSIGMNIGYEMIGKGEEFTRPVLVLQKHNRQTFFALPLGSTQKKNSQHHFPLSFNGRDGSVFITQGRTVSSRRLKKRMGVLPEPVFQEIVKKFKAQF